MTSFNRHSVNAVAQMRKANYKIYTSTFNQWYLNQFYQVSQVKFFKVALHFTEHRNHGVSRAFKKI